MERIVKGIVMESNGNSAIVMTISGEFVKVKKLTSEILIGQEITSRVAINIPWFKYGSLAAAIMLITIMPFIYYKTAYATVAYIDVDINPSLELAINKYNKVNSVIPLNNDAVLLIKNTSLNNIDVQEALSRVIDEAKKMGYIKDTSENTVEISLVKIEEKQVNITGENLINYAKESIAKLDVNAKIEVHEDDKNIRDKAKKENISINKYMNKTADIRKEELKIDVKKSNSQKNNLNSENNNLDSNKNNPDSENNNLNSNKNNPDSLKNAFDSKNNSNSEKNIFDYKNKIIDVWNKFNMYRENKDEKDKKIDTNKISGPASQSKNNFHNKNNWEVKYNNELKNKDSNNN